MEELIQIVSEKTGISTDKARSAIDTVISHLKDKLPMGLGEKIESFLNDGSSSFDDLFGDLKGKLGNIF
ncbi:hypothetical protein [Mucilaginibacter sp.]|jgi:hypothetical protein|uniref:hypothetical protein n=1 Tax=Mucilaginibacter sp. TaxID=1882438 RepID=UPI0035693FFE